MKAIVIAAGRGQRLNEVGEEVPKWLLKVGDKTIADRQLEAFRNNGVDDISVIRGWRKELINFPGLKYYENTDYPDNNILESLFCAKEEMNGGIMTTYSDIVYKEEVVKKLLESKADIGLIVDTAWKDRYEDRTLHPIAEAELVFVEDGQVTKIGKSSDPDRAHGEFIGLALFSEKGTNILKEVYEDVKSNHDGKPFQAAKIFKKAYLTDIIQEIIDRGHVVKNVDIDGGWHEIDTPQDLEAARKIWTN